MKTQISSVRIKGMGRFYGWGKTKELANKELIDGLVSLIEYNNKALRNEIKTKDIMKQKIKGCL